MGNKEIRTVLDVLVDVAVDALEDIEGLMAERHSGEAIEMSEIVEVVEEAIFALRGFCILAEDME